MALPHPAPSFRSDVYRNLLRLWELTHPGRHPTPAVQARLSVETAAQIRRCATRSHNQRISHPIRQLDYHKHPCELTDLDNLPNPGGIAEW